VQALCPVDWRTPHGDRERRAAAYLTATARRSLRQDARDRATWTAEVLRPRLTMTCRITAAQVVPAAPRSARGTYVAVLADRRAQRAGRPPVTDQAEYLLQVVAVSGRWLVDRAILAG